MIPILFRCCFFITIPEEMADRNLPRCSVELGDILEGAELRVLHVSMSHLDPVVSDIAVEA